MTDGKGQSTYWKYDQYSRVANKIDNLGNNLFFYGYDPDNRLTNRVSAAKGTNAYRYDAVGNVTNIIYPVNTNVTLAYDVLNRVTSMVDAVGTTRYTYDAASQLLSEGGLWQDDTVNYTYSNRLRKGLSLAQPSADAWTQTYGYDGAKRLTNVASAAGAFSYAYKAPRATLPATLTLPNGAYITNAYDSVARLLSTVLATSGGATNNSHQYVYNAGNQRTQQVFTAGNFINYAYDSIGQLKTALGTELELSGFYNRLQEQFGYAYDAAGNLNFRTNNVLVESFAVNSLNELTTETNSGTLTVAGTTTSQATNVTVNNSNAALYLDYTFASANQPLVNGNNTFTAIAQDSYGRKDTNAISCYLPASATLFYDLNGNLRTNANPFITFLIYDYDDENQLIRVTSPSQWKSEFSYDGRMRRRIRKEFTWQSNVWVQTNEVHYIYDGNVVIQERWFAPGLSTVVPQNAFTYTRGRDLSGSLAAGLPRQSAATAGGIGGLLARTDNGQLTAGLSSAHAYYHSDGNGNITCLINTNQAIAAKYLYDPFGNLLSQSGALADANLYRFSSKEYHLNSGTTYYLYRFYDPNLQRWLNRDPILEAGGVNLYTYVANRVPNRVDPLGLADGDGVCPGTPPGKGAAQCYQYACGNYGPNSDVPGARGGQRCPNNDCDSLMNAAMADGLTAVPSDGNCPDATHKVALASGTHGGGPDYHWLRQGKGGTWCHKFRAGKPSNLDGKNNPITDPSTADLDFPPSLQQPASSYKFCGYLCSPDTWN